MFGGPFNFLNCTNYLFHLLFTIFCLFYTLPEAKYFFIFLKKSYVYKVGSPTRHRRPVDVRVNETSEMRLNKGDHPIFLLRVITYLFTACPSDNYLLREKISLKNSPSPWRLNGGRH